MPNTPSNDEARMRNCNVGRITWLLRNLEEYSALANEIIDLHCNSVRALNPGVPFAEIRCREIENRAGTITNLVEALRIVRTALIKE